MAKGATAVKKPGLSSLAKILFTRAKKLMTKEYRGCTAFDKEEAEYDAMRVIDATMINILNPRGVSQGKVLHYEFELRFWWDSWGVECCSLLEDGQAAGPALKDARIDTGRGMRDATYG
ncbi:hypothetical protein GLAREA_01096 [Glarea lozoyensis ATCC 20868]|uniref:Uncharacterized protein n=1 Tax=Glarea lozoyensis (strain ATCC 20868 / MF5171) TaxID=1116229 RepID=S3DD65_GLAL2|nr:uncharacterized protein GLAREA_01096 [Glarea lozoyensis ATCC 20868]EPE29936.1 hypothetical protein GLAREA_01096 [Glarea lozoyensis ATCC 20868]